LLERGGALLLLPLSVIPFLLLGPQIAESHRNFKRSQESAPLPAPLVTPTARELALWRPAPASGAPAKVPVLAYAGVGDSAPAVTRLAFARQMEMLSRAGYRTISIHQYARWRRGLPAGLPPHPVLIAFDGGTLDTFRGADRVLQRHGFRATVFPALAAVESGERTHLRWRELHEMERSGRWDVQTGPYVGSKVVSIDSSGQPGEFYAYRRYTLSEGVESFPDWQQRVGRDVFDARAALVAQGFEPVAFSLPGGNYGQRRSNDPRIAGWVRSLLRSQFGGAVLASGDARRFEVGPGTTASALYGWLR
jgi:peptidoglycan/xylan/chitin deacetylase (PgdA/CDA1 family)